MKGIITSSNNHKEMRAFFKEILLNLYIYCGNRQADKMSVEEVDQLLTALERMSKIYSYIPEEKQKEIILTCLVSDREYQNINVRTVSKWLDQNGKVFFTEKHHAPTVEYPPATEEQRQKRLKEWEQMLANTTTDLTSPTKGGGSQLREQFKDLPTQPPKPEEMPKHDEYKHAVKSFWIDGFEIYAKSLEEAEKIYIENFGTNEQTSDQTTEQGDTKNSEGASGEAPPAQQGNKTVTP